MVKITKGSEPKELLQYRQTPNATYDDFRDKQIVTESLLKEQGYLCAYCMRRIPETKVPDGVRTVSIEHWISRSTGQKQLDYRNMVAVCSGNRGCGDKRNLTCDAKRGEKVLRVNPLDENTLRGIFYKSNGEIHSHDASVENDLTETLNLNNTSISLPENRKMVLQSFLKELKKKNEHGNIDTFCRKWCDGFNQAKKKAPFAGIIFYWINKHCKF